MQYGTYNAKTLKHMEVLAQFLLSQRRVEDSTVILYRIVDSWLQAAI